MEIYHVISRKCNSRSIQYIFNSRRYHFYKDESLYPQ